MSAWPSFLLVDCGCSFVSHCWRHSIRDSSDASPSACLVLPSLAAGEEAARLL